MKQELTKRDVQVEIATLIVRGDISSADELAERYGVPFAQAIKLLSNSQFIALVSGISRANAFLAWNGRAMPRLISMLSSADDKTALAAMKMIGQYTDSIKGGNLEININLESMVHQLEAEKNVSNNLNSLDQDFEDAEFRRILNG